METPVYQAIAHTLEWLRNDPPGEWRSRAEDKLARIMAEMPSGSGIDCGTKLDDSSTPDRLVFNVSFHHMNENGYYCGWTEHKVIVTPSLVRGVDIRITGRDRNDIKDYLWQTYEYALTRPIDANSPRYCSWVSESAKA